MLYASIHQYFNVQHRHQHFILITLQISWPRERAELCKAAQPHPHPLLAVGSLQHPIILGFVYLIPGAVCTPGAQEEDLQLG